MKESTLSLHTQTILLAAKFHYRHLTNTHVPERGEMLGQAKKFLRNNAWQEGIIAQEAETNRALAHTGGSGGVLASAIDGGQ